MSEEPYRRIYPAKAKWDGWGYYKKEAKFLCLSLLHISFK